MRAAGIGRAIAPLWRACLAATLLVASVPAHSADPTKVVRHVFPVAETGFDPAGVQDLYSATIEQMLFETLLTYDYLARPAKLVPLSQFEVASRLSYLIWAAGPDDALLDAAAQGELTTKEQVASKARTMLADPKASPRRIALAATSSGNDTR